MEAAPVEPVGEEGSTVATVKKIPNEKVSGEEVFGEITEDLQLEPPRMPSNKPIDIAKAVKDAQAAGFMKGTKPGTVNAAVQEHRHASDVRKALGVKDKVFESAHGGPTSVLKSQSGYSRGRALTELLPKSVHKFFDQHWKDWAIKLRKSNTPKVKAGKFFDEMIRAVNNIPDSDMPAFEKGALIDRIRSEMFSELGLNPSDLIDLPYPNVKPGP